MRIVIRIPRVKLAGSYFALSTLRVHEGGADDGDIEHAAVERKQNQQTAPKTAASGFISSRRSGLQEMQFSQLPMKRWPE